MTASPTPSYYKELIRSVVSGRRWIVARHLLSVGARMAELLERLGASSTFAVAAHRGGGAIQPGLAHTLLHLSSQSLMEGMRAADAAFEDLPREARAAVDAFDPSGQARVVRDLLSSAAPVAGRATYGGRRASWMALEDKTVIDEFWDRAGVPRAPARVVELAFEDALVRADGELDQGLGTVWVGDNRSGVHGAASLLRWVRGEQQALEARNFLAQSCDRVRIMPFLEGIPCSVHGIVFDAFEAALRPCEMLVLRQPSSSRLSYASADTFWDPPPSDRRFMRQMARRVGQALRESVGYRGFFTLDGVMTQQGFLPTELNPRFGAAVEVMAQGISELPLYLMHLALVEGEDLDWRPAHLEAMILERADDHRGGKVGTVLPGVDAAPFAEDLVVDHGVLRLAAPGETVDAHLSVGPSTGGSYVQLDPVRERTAVGPSLGPLAVATLAYLRTRVGLDLPDFQAAADLR